MLPINEILEDNLNPQQLAAATDDAEEILTLACAGSGKSRTLAYRIARLIVEGEEPDSIVAFTFTEKAADSIKIRVGEALGAAGLSPTILGAMYIGTIHSFCFNILGQMDAKYQQYDVLDDNRLILYLMSRYPQLGIVAVRNARGAKYFKTIREIANAWNTVNHEGVNLEEVRVADEELGQVLISLQNQLETDQFIDFSLMIRLVADALLSNDVTALEAVRDIKHLMVDEYQDVNPAQEQLIRELHENSDTLFVVGDDDQSIYGWRGADVSNILTFSDRYPNCSEHTISTNYRSTPEIVDTADGFIAGELGALRIEKNPDAINREGTKHFGNYWFDTREAEADWVVSRIRSLLGTAYTEPGGGVRGLTPADFAVLMRSTRSREASDGPPRHFAFTSRLEELDVPYSLEAGGSVFDRAQVAVMRESFELLRNGQPTRPIAREHFDNRVLPTYPNADFAQFSAELARWGRDIHAPTGGARRRVYPQKLVHDLLRSFGLANTAFNDGVMQDIGLFSSMILDVETVYMSIDSTRRFQDVLNFLSQIAANGYDTSTDDITSRPDTVTVSTVHKMKGLEFPVIFVVDVEGGGRFPSTLRNYQGWLPANVIQTALDRGAYRSTREEEARLFYTALTRAERYLYVSGCALLPNGKRPRRPSPFAQGLAHANLSVNPVDLPDLENAPPERRVDESVVPTSYSEIKYYLRCPKDYKYRHRFGFNPPVPDLFGFGKTVHTGISRLHQRFVDQPPSSLEAEEVSRDTFHLKHVPQSRNPERNPGPYERAQDAAADITRIYAESYTDDFTRNRQIEARFEIPINQAIISGAIDLLLTMDEEENIVDASVIDFKTMEGGEIPEESDDLHWTELALQVQLYAKAAQDVLGENARTGSVHLLKDNQRVEIPISDEAIEVAIENVEWAVDRIVAGEFPARPEATKCENCDFQSICPQNLENFLSDNRPPALYIPGPEGREMARSFSDVDEV